MHCGGGGSMPNYHDFSHPPMAAGLYIIAATLVLGSLLTLLVGCHIAPF
jgi:hypothetical protein